MSNGALEIITAGPRTTVQDAGRFGFAALGVGRSGAADLASYALANRLLANPSGAAALETTLGVCGYAHTGGFPWPSPARRCP